MKTCFRCYTEKPLTDFYKHSQMADGHLNKCKECTKLDVVKHRVFNLEKVQAYDHERKSEPDRLRQRRANAKRTTRLYPQKRRAHSLVQNGIKKGLIVPQPCEKCGAKAEAHHADYDKPLEVRWLCPAHHHAEHRKYDYEAIRRGRWDAPIGPNTDTVMALTGRDPGLTPASQCTHDFFATKDGFRCHWCGLKLGKGEPNGL